MNTPFYTIKFRRQIVLVNESIAGYLQDICLFKGNYPKKSYSNDISISGSKNIFDT